MKKQEKEQIIGLDEFDQTVRIVGVAGGCPGFDYLADQG